MAKKKAHTATFSITLPATSANLGPAFDAAALALSMYLRVKAQVANEFSITASGRDQAICGQIKNHLILKTYTEILHQEGRSTIPLALLLENEIPIGKGCGSSAAARLAGIALANHFGRLRWNDGRIVLEAARREGHADNAAACWSGGLAIARMTDERLEAMRILPKGKWPLLLAVPEESLATEEARRILPDKYSRADAVANLQNSMLLLSAFTQARRDLLDKGLDDRLHQPYRAKLCPLLPALQELSGTNGILGVALSGAGPSVLVFLDPKVSAVQVKRRISARLAARGLEAELIATAISPKGAASSRP
jgi:homoserine kinase